MTSKLELRAKTKAAIKKAEASQGLRQAALARSLGTIDASRWLRACHRSTLLAGLLRLVWAVRF